MTSLDYRNHARPRPLQAMAMRAFARYRPALAGYIHGIVEHGIEVERKRSPRPGVDSLISHAVRRLNQDKKGMDKWRYTRRHCAEVGFLSYLIASEAKRHCAPEASELDPKVCYVGGAVHDIGKTLLPIELMSKELGVELFSMRFFEGTRMTASERSVLRNEHIRAGSAYVRLFGGNGKVVTILDMVGLHHVMYNGEDSIVPSYPRLVIGRDKPFHARIAKTADFLSAILPRHYREENWVLTPPAAVAHAMAIAGMELDPVTVRCILTGTYDVSWEEAGQLITAFMHPEGQAGISSRGRLRDHIEEGIMRDPRFIGLVSALDLARATEYEAEVEEFAAYYGLPSLADVSQLSIKNIYPDAA